MKMFIPTLLVSLVLFCHSAFALPETMVDVNTASAEELAVLLVGIGESRAAAIVAHREQHGDFADLQDLLAVRGIGEKVLADNKARIILE